MCRNGGITLLREILSGNIGFADAIVFILSALAVIFLTMPVHEFAHGFVAVKLGDNTPRWQGRLSLNPFAHIDYMGALCILLLGFGWAKPVQVNMRNFKNPKADMAITALAGPVANIIVAFFGFFLASLCDFVIVLTSLNILSFVSFFFWYVAYLNVTLAIFNLIPIPPFDGSRIMGAFLPDRIYYRIMQYERIIFIVLIALLWTGVLELPINGAVRAVTGILEYVTQLPFGLILS